MAAGICCNPCFPYKDPLLVTSQVLCVLAFLLSIGFYGTFLLGAMVMLLMEVLCCCRLDAAAIYVFTVTCVIASATSIFAGVKMVTGDTPDVCLPFLTIQFACNDIRELYGIMHYVAGGLWMISACLNITFVKSGRYNRFEDEYDNVDSEVNQTNVDEEAVAVAVPVPTQ